MEKLKEYAAYPIGAAVSWLFAYLTAPPGLEWLQLVAIIAALAGCAIGQRMGTPQPTVRWLILAAAVAGVSVLGYFIVIAYGIPGIPAVAALIVLILLIFVPADSY